MTSTKLQALLAATAIVAIAAASPAAAADERREYHLIEQDLGAALNALGQASGGQINFASDAVAGKRAPRLDGTYTLKEAVEHLLRGSGLVAVQRSGAILVRPRLRPTSGLDDETEEDIVVTGTRIRGAPPISPVTIVRREEAQRAGQTDLGQIIRDLPQNFSGGQNPTISGLGQVTQNGNGSSALNLRGLGPDASLTLINGHRVAFDAIYQGVDIAAIPLAAIERIDIAADGASALYGADAVGGVANVILRRRIEGIYTSASLGMATDGGAVTQQYSAVAGPSWKSGSFMVAGDYRDTSQIAARQRSYTSRIAPDATIIAGSEQTSFVMAGEQALADGLKFEIDANYLHRSMRQCLAVTTLAPNLCANTGSSVASKVTSWSVSPSLRFDHASGWEFRLGGTYSQSKTKIDTTNRSNGNVTTIAMPRYDNTLKAIDLSAEGPVFSLPGGTARVALGAGYRSTRLNHDLRRIVGGQTVPVMIFAEPRDVAFGYGEIFLPLISPANGISFVQKLHVVGALRYEDHSGVGHVATPKIGVIYEPLAGFQLKANWGKSFKAPTLYQLGQASNAQLLSPSNFTPTPPGELPVLYLFGGNPNLGPERATTWNITGAISPLEGLRAELSYFQIKYRGRVASPINNSTIAFLPAYSSQVKLNPTAQDVQAALNGISGIFTNLSGSTFDPARVSAILSDFLQNVSLQSVKGFDASLAYTHDFGTNGTLSIKAAATHLDSERQTTSALPVVPQAGVVFTPAHWRGRASASWVRDDFAVVAIANYVGPTQDNRFAPITRIGSFTTFDTILTVKTGEDRGLLSNVEWRVAAQNLFNKAPAIIRTSSPALAPFDSLNQSPLGRVVTLTLSKVW